MFKRFLNVAALAATLIFATAGAVFAHEGREVGDYAIDFGWQAEPAYVGYPNGPEVTISLHGAPPSEGASTDPHDEAANPLEGVEVDLSVEVTFGPATRTMPLTLSYGTFDHYAATLIPTRPGDYTFRVFGTIGDVAVDEVFTSSAGEFSTVEPAGDVTFPDELPSLAELLERLAALEARIAALES